MPKFYFQVEVDTDSYHKESGFPEHAHGTDFLFKIFQHRYCKYLEDKIDCMAGRQPHNAAYPHKKNCAWCKEYQRMADELKPYLGNWSKKVKFLRKES